MNWLKFQCDNSSRKKECVPVPNRKLVIVDAFFFSNSPGLTYFYRQNVRFVECIRQVMVDKQAINVAMMVAATTATNITRIKHTYKTLARLIEGLPTSEKIQRAKSELRQQFRKPLSGETTIDERLRAAGEQIAFLRCVTPSISQSHKSQEDSSDSGAGGGRWVYKNGKAVEVGNGKGGTWRSGSRVHTNWDGNNLDPCSVKRHRQQLKRAGFVNNLHAKGIF